VFNKIVHPNVVSWNAMIAGYAMHGCGSDALRLFEQMQQRRVKLNHITLIGVLTACSHAGLVNEGRKYFDCMSQSYNITPTVEHYACMVDLLGRAGLLTEAKDFIDKMPITPNSMVWGCLLGACRVHNNTELGEIVVEHLFELDSKDAAPYAVLSNIYAAAGR
jgi:pentatricopeptide repeat protein